MPVIPSASSGASHSRAHLVSLVWPNTASPISSALRGVVLALAGTALLVLSAKINVPLPYVPMTMQSLVVLMLGAAYGPRLAAATIFAYIAEGAMGLPVFAGPVGGLGYIAGPTGGYLAGFVLAAVLAGWLSERGWDRSILRMSLAMGFGHVVMIGCGFLWLVAGTKVETSTAWLVGVAPFIAGSVVKSLLGAVLLPMARRGADSLGN